MNFLVMVGCITMSYGTVCSTQPLPPVPDRASPLLFYSDGTTISNAPTPKCDDGWTLMTYPGTDIPMCVRELKQPHS